VLEALRTLRLELDSLFKALKGVKGKFVISGALRTRIQEFYLSWSNLRPLLDSNGIPTAVTHRAETLSQYLVRLSLGNSSKQLYATTVQALRGVLARELLLEIARLQPVASDGKLSVRPPDNTIFPEIPGLRNELIPDALYGSADKMRAFLRQNSYDRNVFIMVAYRPALNGLVSDLSKALIDLELNPIIARDHSLTEDLYNPLACLLCCHFGVAIFDRGDKKQRHNANIVYELATMHLLKRRCVILKHEDLATMPSDFLHKLYEPYRTRKDAVKAIRVWWERLQKMQ
jgi:hypothetical protein